MWGCQVLGTDMNSQRGIRRQAGKTRQFIVRGRNTIATDYRLRVNLTVKVQVIYYQIIKGLTVAYHRQTGPKQSKS